MKSPILTGKGTVFYRVVKSQRTFRGQPIGVIRDKGYLVSVWQLGDAWMIGRVIRKLKG